MIRIEALHVFQGPSTVAPWRCATALVRFNRDAGAPAAVARLAAQVAPLLGPSDDASAPDAEPPDLATLIARLAIGLQNSVGPAVSRFDITRCAPAWRIAVDYADTQAAAEALKTAVRWAAAALSPDHAQDARRRIDRFTQSFRMFSPHLEQQRLVEEALRRGIPWRRKGTVQWLGWGARRRAISRIMTDDTANLSVSLATSKPAAASLMATAGIPVPRHKRAGDPDAAVRVAGELGYPVVMKPASSDMGVGVHLDIGDADAVARTFPFVARHGPVLVERQHAGADHRLLVVGGKLVAAAIRLPAQVTGDGRHSVRQLVELTNADPRRGVDHSNILERIRIDEEAERVLRNQGLGPDYIPASGRTVKLRLTANLSTGGTSVDVTQKVHPDNRVLAERAARVVGLDIAGIDLITPDIGKSHLEVGGVVCEINPTPGFRPHLSADGSPDVIGAVIDALFPPPDNGRIPTALVTGTNGKTTTCRMLAAILEAAGHTVGLATTDGVQIGGDRIAIGDEAGPRGANMLLADPAVTAAVLETARGGIIKFGVGLDRYAVAALLNVGTDHIGLDGVESVEDMARVKSTVLAGAEHAIVLNADDPHCLALAAQANGRKLILVGCGPGSPALAAHIEDGGHAVLVDGSGRDARLVAVAGRRAQFAMKIDSIPATFSGAAGFNVQNAMFGAALAMGLEVPFEAIGKGLAAFRPDIEWSPCRANLITAGPVRILIDFAHNAEAVAALGAFVSRIPVQGLRRMLLDAPGDRIDASYAAVAGAAADGPFQHFVCSCEEPRGRPPGETSRLLAEGLARHGVDPTRIEAVEPFDRAIGYLLQSAQPGDLLVIPCGAPGQVLDHPAFATLASRRD